MNKAQSGGVLIAIGFALNFVGRMLRDNGGRDVAGVVALVMFVAVVLILFGLFRVVSGLISKS